MGMMLPVWQMMLPWRFSGHLQEDWVWPWGGLLPTWWPHHPAIACLISFCTRHLQDSLVGCCSCFLTFWRQYIELFCQSSVLILILPVCAHPSGIKLTGGIGSKWQGIYCLEVVPGSPASEEGSVQPNDKILYICGRCTLGMTLEDAVKACEIAPRKVKLKIIRYVPTVATEIKTEISVIWLWLTQLFVSFTERNSQWPPRLSGTVRASEGFMGWFQLLDLTQGYLNQIVWLLHWWIA